MPSLLPPPVDLGAPPKFAEWRHYQDTAIFDAAETDKRFVLQVIPTGAGKSLIYVMLAKLLGVRAVVLTRTKALQAQLTNDFAKAGMGSVQGMNAYRCQALLPGGELYGVFTELAKKAEWVGCDDGPCRVGANCTLKGGGCEYFDAVDRARQADLLVTNYTYWLYQTNKGKGLGEFGLLILDEAHDAPEALSEYLTVKLEPWELQRIGSKPIEGTPDIRAWKEWGTFHHERVSAKAEDLAGEIKRARDAHMPVKRSAAEEAKLLTRLAGVLSAISSITEDWVVYREEKGTWTFTPAWPAPYAERALFQGIPKVILTSATVRPKTANYLGIREQDLKVTEYPSTFPAARRPVLHIPTVKMTYRWTEADKRIWLSRIDQIIGARGDRKGIIHTVSYARMKDLAIHSRFKDRMITHSGDGTRLAIQRFKSAPQDSGAILVSPAVTTGYDFPYEECEYQVIAKVPFPDSRDPVLQARTNQDSVYGMYMAMQALVQMCGRGMRAQDDLCETFIVDDQVKWFVWKHRDLAPKWFLDTLKSVALIPAPAPRLHRQKG